MTRTLPLLVLLACAEPVDLPDETPSEIPHVPENVAPAIEAEEASRIASASAAVVRAPDEENATPTDRLAAERAALDQLTKAAQGPPPPGRVHLLAPTDVRGRFNPESLRGVMNPKLEELESCYTDVLKEDRHAVGRVVAEWTVSGGRVTDVGFAPGAMETEPVHACLSEWLRGLRVRGGGRVVITQPFLFHHAI